MIAGTYTPFTLVRMGGAWGLGIAVLRLARRHRRHRAEAALSAPARGPLDRALSGHRLGNLVALGPLFAAVPLPAIVLIGIGGLLYSFGVVFHLWHRLPYHNAIWHGFVLGAAGVPLGRGPQWRRAGRLTARGGVNSIRGYCCGG